MTESLKLKNLAQIWSVAKYTKESHIGFSEAVLNYLEKQNFMNHT